MSGSSTALAAGPPDSKARRRSTGFVIAGVVAAVGFLALSVAARLGRLDAIDQLLAARARPDAVWGPLQQQVSPAVDVLGPEPVAVALALVLVAVMLRRGSMRSSLVPVVTAAAGGAIVFAVKMAVGRSDVQGRIIGNGSFPSGHALAITLVTGLVLLLLWSPPRWWHLALPLVPGFAMGVVLVVIGMHWSGDALGSILLAEALIAGAAAWIIEHPDQ